MCSYLPSSVYPASLADVVDPAFHTHSSLVPHHIASFAAEPTYKKRKIERACDACRRRKTKCDGPRMPDNVCTNCIQNRKTCSYLEASKPRGPPKAYITSLEDRLERMEALLKRLRPEADFSQELGPPVIRDSWRTDADAPAHVSPHEKSSSTVSSSKWNRPRSAGAPSSDTDSSPGGYSSSESEEVGELSVSRGLKRLTVRGLEPTQDHHPFTDNQVRFHGKSSFFKLIEPTRKLRDEHLNRVTGGEERSRSARDSTSPINAAALRRPEFWTTPPWELAFDGFQDRLEKQSLSLAQRFPPQDLADSLIKLYFEHINPFIPILHRPTFERQWGQGLQYKDSWFGCLCLSVFAVASRWSDDPRLLDDSEYDVSSSESPSEEHKWQRVGWRFFNTAVDLHRGSLSLFHPAGLFEVQTMALFGMFLRGTAFHPVSWLFVSIGLRKAQDVGAHRKKIYGDKPSAEGELWKRAFWALVVLDRLASASLGRPCCSGEEEFDAELPLEVDDDYWETDDPEKAFQQPPDKPSKIAAFNSHLKLTKIVAYAMRTIYALDRSKLLFSAARPRWQDVLVRLNHEMTEWADSVPKHLRWSPHIDDPLFSNQSATLYITYYLIQIIIYRPFLPPSLHSVMNITPHSNMPIPCIAICVNAGKCVSRILKAQISRGYSNVPCLILGSHVCAAILLMNFWDLKWQERNLTRYDAIEDIKSPLALAMAELLESISVLIEALKAVKPRWRIAEMYLNDLTSSLPHSLGGFEPSSPKNVALPSHYLPRFDDHPYHNTTPPDYTTLGDYGNPPPKYRVTPSPITTYGCDTPVEPSEPTPHFFEFPHITQYPVPSALPIPPFIASCERNHSALSQLTSQPRRGYERLSMPTEVSGQRSSTPSVHPRPASSFEEKAIYEMPAIQRDSSVCQEYATDGRAFRDRLVSVSTHRVAVNNFGYNQPRPAWASDWNYNPTDAREPSSDSTTSQHGFLSRGEEIRSSLGQVLSLPRHH